LTRKRFARFPALLFILVLGFAFLPATAAFAADFTVTDPVDANTDGTCDTECTLRDAIIEANDNDEADTITFAATAQVNLLTEGDPGDDDAAAGDLDITDELTIDGGGTATVDASGLDDRVFDVLESDLTITGLTVMNGSAPETGDGAEDRGGNIRLATDSTVDISDSVISGGTAPTAGGGIENTGGTLTVTDTDFTGNEATGTAGGGGNGGAIHDAGGTTTVSGGTVSANTAVEGGGFWNSGGTFDVDGVTFDGNTADGEDADQGGGAFYSEGGGTVTVDGSTFTANTATEGSGSGGAILNNETDTALTVSDSTFTDNAANRAGGAIENVGPATLTVTESDFETNDVAAGAMPGNVGAIHNGGGTVDVTGGTATGNTAVEGGAFWNAGGTFTVTDVDFDGNDASGEDASQGGGAIYNEGMGTVDVTDSTFDNNTAIAGSGSGGAILNIETDTVLTVDGSTFTGNSAARAGGAIENAQGDADITDTDFDGNDVAENANPGNGGAIHDGGGNVTVTGGLVENNTAVEGGGFWTNGTLTLVDVTFENNTAEAGGALYVQAGGTLDTDGVTATDDEATEGDGNALFAESMTTTTATDTTLTSDNDGLTCNVLVDNDEGGNADDDESCFGFQVDRIFGDGRIETAIAISQDHFETGTAQAVVLSRPDIFPDALAGSPLAIQEDAPLLLTSQDGIDDIVEDEINRVLSETGTVFLLGETAALNEQVEDDAEALGFDVIRLGGANRFETAAIIATDGIDDPRQIFLADGSDFPDAVTAGAAAGSTESAVILTGADTVPPETQDFLDDNDAPLFAIGGPAAAAVESATPVVGDDRIDTSVEVAERFFDDPSIVGLATGADFPDALAGGVLVGAQDGPLLLTFGDMLDDRVADYLDDNRDAIDRLVLFGGRDALSQGLEDEVEDLLTDDQGAQ
jgi:predicted outer membrane repeat protein